MRRVFITHIGFIFIVVFACLGMHIVSARAALTSPTAVCAYYESRWEKGLIKVLRNESDVCLVQVGDTNSGIGYIRGYYSGGKFCLSSTGAYFNNSGLKDSTECVSVSGRGGMPSSGNPFLDLLKDPNLKWYTLAAVVIAMASLLAGRNRRGQKSKK